MRIRGWHGVGVADTRGTDCVSECGYLLHHTACSHRQSSVKEDRAAGEDLCKEER